VITVLSLVTHKNTHDERLHVEKVSWFEVWSVLWHIIGVCDVGSETVTQLHTFVDIVKHFSTLNAGNGSFQHVSIFNMT